MPTPAPFGLSTSRLLGRRSRSPQQGVSQLQRLVGPPAAFTGCESSSHLGEHMDLMGVQIPQGASSRELPNVETQPAQLLAKADCAQILDGQ